MNKRKEAKEKTRAKIIRAAEEAFLKKGISQTLTAEIAEECGIAHGTIFLHFETKDDLVSEVFIATLRTSAIELDECYQEKGTFQELVDTFFRYIAAHEKLFEVYFRELPLFSKKLKREIHSFEVALRNSFYNSLKDENVREHDIPVLLNLLFAQLLYYYAFKEVLCGKMSVIETYGQKIEDSVVRLIKSGGSEMEEKICQSCGMPMKEAKDFGGGDPANIYCVHCTYDDGSLKPYEVKLEEMAQFIMSRSGATLETARKTAAENLATMPAWRKR